MIILPIFIYPIFPLPTKKSDLEKTLEDLVKKYRKSYVVGAVLNIGVFLLMPLGLYAINSDFNDQTPLYPWVISGLATVIILFSLWRILKEETLDSDEVGKLRQDNSDIVLIKGNVINQKSRDYFRIGVALMIFCLFFSFLIPLFLNVLSG